MPTSGATILAVGCPRLSLLAPVRAQGIAGQNRMRIRLAQIVPYPRAITSTATYVEHLPGPTYVETFDAGNGGVLA